MYKIRNNGVELMFAEYEDLLTAYAALPDPVYDRVGLSHDNGATMYQWICDGRSGGYWERIEATPADVRRLIDISAAVTANAEPIVEDDSDDEPD